MYSMVEDEELVDGVWYETLELYSYGRDHLKHMVLLFNAGGYVAEPKQISMLGDIRNPMYHVSMRRRKRVSRVASDGDIE